MSPLDWFKKQKPLMGLMGSGGGLANAGAAEPKVEATGGTTNTYSTPAGSFKSHTFSTPHTSPTTSSTFVVTADGFCDIIMTGGGGSGGDGNANGGGGGGGSCLVGTTVPVSATGGPGGNGIYPMVIGMGGTRVQSNAAGVNGDDTTMYVDIISGQASAYGGSGGEGYNRNPSPRGNGGGGAGPYAPSKPGGAANLWPVPGPMNGGDATWTSYGVPGSVCTGTEGVPGQMGGSGGGSGGPYSQAPGSPYLQGPYHAMPGLTNAYRTGTDEYYGAGGGGAEFSDPGYKGQGMFGGRQGTVNGASPVWGRGGGPPNPPAGASPAEPGPGSQNAGTPGQPLYGSGGGGCSDNQSGRGGSGSIIIRYKT